jgi:hypothetical protein
MHNVTRILVSGFAGAVMGAILGFLMFFILTILDNIRFDEALAYSLVVAVVGAFMGGVIGLAVGMGNLGVVGGGIAGVVMTLLVGAFYVFAMGRPGRYGYFLGASTIIYIVLTVPAVLTGILTALFKNLLYKH